MTEQPYLLYTIDQEDRIVEVGGEWDQAARGGYAEELTSPLVLQASLWDFIEGRDTRLVYEMLLERVRASGQAVELSLRCDTPSLRRQLTLTISPRPDQGVSFATAVAQQEARPHVFLLDASIPRRDEWLTICSWCKRVELPHEHWVEVEEAVQVLGLFEQIELPQLTHGMCPVCRTTFLAKARAGKRSGQA